MTASNPAHWRRPVRNRRRRAPKVAAVLALAAIPLLVTGCTDSDPRPCLADHQVTELIPMSTGKTVLFIPYTHTVCDRYGPAPRRS